MNKTPQPDTNETPKEVKSQQTKSTLTSELVETRTAINIVIPRANSIKNQLKQRTSDYLKRRESLNIHFPLSEIDLAVTRTGESDQLVLDLIQIIKTGKYNILSAGAIIEENNNLFFNVGILESKDKNTLTKLKAIPGAWKLFKMLDDDLTMAGKPSIRCLKFKQARLKMVDKTTSYVFKYGKEYIDYNYELAGKESSHTFQSEETKENYQKLQNICQNIIDKLFQTLSLKDIKGKTFLTRSKECGAFVYSEHGEGGLNEILENAKDSNKQVELPVYIHVGLLMEIESYDELAGVLGHELAHLLQPTYIQQSKQLMQRLEYDADKTSMYLCDAAGFNPKGILNFLKRHKKTSFLSKLGVYDHPDTESRIIELEKEYHRKDLPLINASKEMQQLPIELKKALENLEEPQDKSFDKKLLTEKEKNNQLEVFLEGTNIPELFLNPNFYTEIKTIAEERLRKEMVQQEIVYGTHGVRDYMLEMIRIFMLAQRLNEYNKDPNVNYKSKIAFINKQRKKDDEENHLIIDSVDVEVNSVDNYFKVPQQNRYLQKGQQINNPLVNQDNTNIDIIKAEMTAVGIDLNDINKYPKTIQGWIDTYTPEVQLFWQMVIPPDGSNDKTERLKYFISLLYNQIFFVTTNKELFSIKKEEKHVTEHKPPQVTRVRDLPLLFRFHSRNKQDNSNNGFPKNGIKEKKCMTVKSANFSLSPKFLKTNPQDQAILIQDLAALIKRKIINSYLEVLGTDGQEKPSKEICNFLLSHCLDQSVILLEGTEPSITFLDHVLKALKAKSIWKNYDTSITDLEKTQKYLISVYSLIIAFALKPQNDREKMLQDKHLSIVANNPFLAEITLFPLTLYYNYKTSEEDFNKHFDEKFIQNASCNNTVQFYIDSERILAAWKLHKNNLIDDLNKTLNSPEESALDTIRENDTQICYLLLKRIKSTKKSIFDKTFRKPSNAEKKHLAQTTAKAIAVMRKHFDLSYTEIIQDQNSLITQYHYDHRWNNYTICPQLLQIIAEEIAAYLHSLFQKVFGVDFTLENTLSLILSIYQQTRTEQDKLIRTQEIKYLQVKISNDEPKNIDYTTALYRKKDAIMTETLECENMTELTINWLKALNITKPEVSELIQYLQKQNVEITAAIMAICLGNFVPYRSFNLNRGNENNIINRPKKPLSETTREIITIMTLCSKIYHQQWQNIEEYKRLNEQLSNWEWLMDNPIAGDLAYRINNTYGQQLGLYYKVETGDMIDFSWPLLIQDLWENNLNLSTLNEDEKEGATKKLNQLKAIIKSLIDDKKPGDTNKKMEILKKMQPGFFREFIVAQRMQKAGIKSIEEVEKWLPYLTSRPHEASKNNQIHALLEDKINGITETRKKALMIQAINELLPGIIPPEREKCLIYVDNPYNSMQEEDCDLYFSTYNHVYTSFSQSELNEIQKAKLFLDRYKQEIKLRYINLINEEIKRIQKIPSIPEENIFLFSDQIVENDKSRLEVGPIYLFRFLAQPLMDWHIDKLREANSFEQVRKCRTKILSIFPEKHPLRDLFLKNQLNCEIIQIIKDFCKPSNENVILSETKIDLTRDLPHFPLNSKISFIKKYSLFNLEGLNKAIDNLPIDTIKRILTLISDYIENFVSETTKSTLRRMMFNIEEKAIWPSLIKDRHQDPKIFNQYLEHILRFYPNPSIERDHLLDTIAINLALITEEITKTWNLRYEQKVRWPEQKEEQSVKIQYETVEKMRLIIGAMSRTKRSAYIIWLIGGKAPLSYTFSTQETGVSLNNRREVFWQMKPNERRNLLYNIFLDSKGLLNTEHHFNDLEEEEDSPFKKIENELSIVNHLTEEIFNVLFENQSINDNLPPDHPENINSKDIIKIIFQGLFSEQNDPVRRAELLINIIDAIGEAKNKGERLKSPDTIRILAEQGGVVIIKFAQLLSEQPNLLPKSIKNTLSELKDKASAVSKRSELTYLQETGWLDEEDDSISEIGEIVGSASIKQARAAKLKNGEKVAIKTKKPNIDKYFKEDIVVVKGILKQLEKKYKIPTYLVTEVETVINEELDFRREVENQIALRNTLKKRKAKLEIPTKNKSVDFPIVIAEPISLTQGSAIHDAKIGLIVEEFAQGLSLKDIQSYQNAFKINDTKTIKNIREKLSEQYPNSIPNEIEQRIMDIDIDHLQANLAIELLKQIIQDGVFHADPHTGNIIFDFNHCVKNGKIHQGKAVLIDLGSCGYSKQENMPESLKKEYPDRYDTRNDFRDFLSALFSQKNHNHKLAEIVNKFTSLNWTAKDLDTLFTGDIDTQQKVKKIFYQILKDTSENKGKVDIQFRYFLKTIATAATHLDKLKEKISLEINYIFTHFTTITEDEMNKMLFSVLQKENLLNIELLT